MSLYQYQCFSINIWVWVFQYQSMSISVSVSIYEYEYFNINIWVSVFQYQYMSISVSVSIYITLQLFRWYPTLEFYFFELLSKEFHAFRRWWLADQLTYILRYTYFSYQNTQCLKYNNSYHSPSLTLWTSYVHSSTLYLVCPGP